MTRFVDGQQTLVENALTETKDNEIDDSLFLGHDHVVFAQNDPSKGPGINLPNLK